MKSESMLIEVYLRLFGLRLCGLCTLNGICNSSIIIIILPRSLELILVRTSYINILPWTIHCLYYQDNLPFTNRVCETKMCT